MTQNEVNKAATAIADLYDAVAKNDLDKAKAAVAILNTLDLTDTPDLLFGIPDALNRIWEKNRAGWNEAFYYVVNNLRVVDFPDSIVWRVKITKAREEDTPEAIAEIIDFYLDNGEFDSMALDQKSLLLSLAVYIGDFTRLDAMRERLVTD